MVFGTSKPDPYIVDKQHFATAPIVLFYNVNSPIFEFPHFVIHSDKRFPSQSDENTLHIKAL